MGKRTFNAWILLAVVLCLGGGFYWGWAKGKKEELSPVVVAATNAAATSIGKNTKELTLKDLKGEAVTLRQFIPEGKPVILNVWATWCPPCVKELPSLHELSLLGKYHVVTVATDRKTDVVENYLKKHNFHYLLVLWDENARTLRNEIGAKQLPITFIMDENLNIKGVEAGEREWNHPDMIKKIERYLK